MTRPTFVFTDARYQPLEIRETAFRDSRGRLAGGSVRRADYAARLLADGEKMVHTPGASYWSAPSVGIGEDGRTYAFRPHSTRDGKAYGATQAQKFYATPAERDAAVEAYFVGMEKRARKADGGKTSPNGAGTRRPRS